MSIFERLGPKNKKDRFQNRLDYLKNELSYDTKIISVPIAQTIDNIQKGSRSFVMYGEPQSGKTEVMIALVCRLLDIGKQTIFIIMNDSLMLETQNFHRFKAAQQINPSPMQVSEFRNLPLKDQKSNIQRVIFCRKNAKELEHLIEATRFCKNRVLIDDEADYASPNSKINKGEVTAINRLVGKLGQLGDKESGVYLGVTATPARLNLNNTYANDANEWVFLEAHKSYKGRAFFFPTNKEERQASNYIAKLTPDEGDDPKHLRESFLRFLVRVAILNLKDPGEGKEQPYSMLIHTHATKIMHRDDQKQIRDIVSVLVNHTAPKIENYFKYMQDQATYWITHFKLNIEVDDVLRFIRDEIGRHEILVINSDNDKENVEAVCNPKVLFTVGVGGNTVSRGLTFKRLLTFFFSRGVKGKFNTGTYIQRARMFGQRELANYFELCIPKSLYEEWHELFTLHERSLLTAKSGNYVHLFSSRNRPADAASIQKSTTISQSKESPASEIFELNSDLEKVIANSKIKGLDRIKFLIREGYLKEESIAPWLFPFIENSLVKGANELEFVISSENPPGFVSIDKYSDNDPTTIGRKRGGLIAATINDRPKLMRAEHLIMCAKLGNKGRFWYRNNLAQSFMRNIKNDGTIKKE